MKILFLSLRCPYPPHRGDRIRTYHFIKQLAQRHSLTLVFFVESDQEIAHARHLETFCDRVEWVRFRRSRACLNSALHCFSRHPLQLYYWYSPQMQRTIDRLLHEDDFELIHAQLFRMGQYVSHVQETPKMLDLCDSMALNLSRRADLDRSLKRPLVKLEAKRVQRYEVEIMKSFDWGTVVAEFDRDYLLEQDATLNLSVVSMGVDLDYFQPTTLEYRPHLLFTGTMSYFPNWDAAIYFYREVFPIVQKTHPETTFYIVGNSPTEQIRRLATHGNVVVTGHVPETHPYFDDAAVFVAPLRAGSGIQVKNLEAMSMGVPVVTTSIGAMGLEADAGQDLLIGDTPETFAKHVTDLLEDKEYRQTIGSAGRKLVETKYNWDVLGQRLEDVYSRICEPARKT